jgi:hypothetical protein
MKFPFISARNVVFKEQVNVSLLAEIRVRLGKILGRSARNEMVFLRFKFHSFVRGRAATVRFEAECLNPPLEDACETKRYTVSRLYKILRSAFRSSRWCTLNNFRGNIWLNWTKHELFCRREFEYCWREMDNDEFAIADFGRLCVLSKKNLQQAEVCSFQVMICCGLQTGARVQNSFQKAVKGMKSTMKFKGFGAHTSQGHYKNFSLKSRWNQLCCLEQKCNKLRFASRKRWYTFCIWVYL